MMPLSEAIAQQEGRLVSLTTRISPTLVGIAFLKSVGMPRFVWQSGDELVVGMGTVLTYTAWGADRFEKIQNHLENLFDHAHIQTPDERIQPRVFGGFAFRDDFIPDNTWADFAPAEFVLPHYQFSKIGDEAFLTINAELPEGETVDELLVALDEALHTMQTQIASSMGNMPRPSTPQEIHYPMNYGAWEHMISHATQRIKNGDLQKVVLSRMAEIRFDEWVNVNDALTLLQTQPNTHRFIYEPRPYVAFFGATPEILAEVRGNHIQTMALAGTIKRGASDDETAQLAQRLLNDPKERHEHQIVIDRIQQRLTNIATNIRVGTTDVMRLAKIQHLYTPIHAKVAHAGILSIVAQLHPTPALGGEPRETALALISELEPMPRGWFGAPIGWVDAHMNGQFGVAIRSGIAQHNRVWLYAGAGIVGDSQPQKEWDETALKLRTMLDALRIQDTL
jgi:menaquinone-specific isochorismate synthase